MEPETFRSIVDQLIAGDGLARQRRIPLHGTGEPLLSPHLWENLAYLDKHGFSKVDFTTNGMLLDGAARAWIAGHRCLEWVRVSLNSSRREVYDAVNEGGDYDLILENIRAFCKAGGRFRPVVQLMQTRINEDETEEEMLGVLGCRPSIMRKRLDTFAGQCDPAGLGYPAAPPKDCKFGNQCLYFHWNGDIAGCCFDDSEEQLIGNQRDGIFSAAVTARREQMVKALSQRDWKTLPICGLCYGCD